jgi:hypothetical protein
MTTSGRPFLCTQWRATDQHVQPYLHRYILVESNTLSVKGSTGHGISFLSPEVCRYFEIGYMYFTGRRSDLSVATMDDAACARIRDRF